MESSSSTYRSPYAHGLRMGNFFWENSNDHRVGLFPTHPVTGEFDEPFLDFVFPEEGTWKLAVSFRGWLLFRKVGAAFSFFMYDFDRLREFHLPPPESFEGDVYSYGLIVDRDIREKFRLVCVQTERKVRTFDSDSCSWSAAVTAGIENTKSGLAWNSNLENEPPVLANGGILYWLYGRRHVRSYDARKSMFSIIKLPKDDCAHARLSVSGQDDDLHYVAMGWKRIKMWYLRGPASTVFSRSWHWRPQRDVPLEEVAPGMKLQSYDYYNMRRKNSVEGARDVWALGVDLLNYERVYLWVLPNRLYYYDFLKKQLVHILDVPEEWLPMNPRLYPYAQEIS